MSFNDEVSWTWVRFPAPPPIYNLERKKMYNIKYKIINAKIRPGYDVPFFISKLDDKPLEEGVIGIDCATLITPFGKFTTAKSTYTVLSKELDISKDEPLLVISVSEFSSSYQKNW